MRLPRVRFTVRRMMMVVAVLALVLGLSVEAIRLRRARSNFLKLASENDQNERLFRLLEASRLSMADINESYAEHSKTIRRPLIPFVYPDDANIPEMNEQWAEAARQKSDDVKKERAQAKIHHEMAEFHAALREKYLAAAARPWQSVEPDPLPPDPMRRAFYWYERGDHRHTVSAYREALKNDPDDGNALNGLARLVATCPDPKLRNGRLAVELATRACERIQWADPSFLDTLAAAYAEAGDFESATCLEREAIANLVAGDANLPAFKARLQLYQNKKPYRDQAKSSS